MENSQQELNEEFPQYYFDFSKRKRKIRKFSFVLLGIFLIAVVLLFYLFEKNITIDSEITVKKGDTFQKVYNNLSLLDRASMKFFTITRNKKISLKPGNYNFSGSYEKGELIKRFEKGPEKNYTDVKIIEGWSKYEIDSYLTKKGIIQSGDYIYLIEDENVIKKKSKKFDFLKEVSESESGITSLEGFLYPDTYKVDLARQDYLDVLLSQQLNAFEKKVRRNFSGEMKNIDSELSEKGLDFSLSLYDLVKLASIVEREEKKQENKKLVAGIFLNRLASGMNIGADISLCYGLGNTINQCKNDIDYEVDNKGNSYNTRTNNSLPPTPIGNPSLSTIKSLLNFKKTAYYYYLHDKDGNIHPSENISNHNYKKSKYLNN